MIRRGLLTILLLLLASQAVAGTGLGIIIGEPTGLSFKRWTGADKAVDAAAAWSFEGEDALHLHGDFLYHRRDLLRDEGGSLPLYFGIGARLKLEEDDSRIGARFPIGLDYSFDGGRFDLFLELVPLMDVVPDTDFSMNGGLGLRYWFK